MHTWVSSKAIQIRGARGCHRRAAPAPASPAHPCALIAGSKIAWLLYLHLQAVPEQGIKKSKLHLAHLVSLAMAMAPWQWHWPCHPPQQAIPLTLQVCLATLPQKAQRAMQASLAARQHQRSLLGLAGCLPGLRTRQDCVRRPRNSAKGSYPLHHQQSAGSCPLNRQAVLPEGLACKDLERAPRVTGQIYLRLLQMGSLALGGSVARAGWALEVRAG